MIFCSYSLATQTITQSELICWTLKVKQLPDLSGLFLSVGIIIQTIWHAYELKCTNVLQSKVIVIYRYLFTIVIDNHDVGDDCYYT